MFSRQNPSPAYVAGVKASAAFHKASGKFEGARTAAAVPALSMFLEESRADRGKIFTCLDYGCGKGKQHPALGKTLDMLFTLYDPCVNKFASLPTWKFDLVMSIDVLQYVPESDIDWVLAEIFGYAKKAVFINASVPKPKKLVSEWNRTAQWWLDCITRAAKSHLHVEWRMRLWIRGPYHRIYAGVGGQYQLLYREGERDIDRVCDLKDESCECTSAGTPVSLNQATS